MNTRSQDPPSSFGFPVLDDPRTEATAELGRVVVEAFGNVEPHVDTLDNWCSMPVRLAHDAAAGWHIELGPYDLDAADIRTLRRAFAAYDQAIGRQR